MPGLSRHLKQLEKELLALGEESMLIEELDGFIAGLLVCPDLIKPGEWLPIVWSQDRADPQSAFDNLDHVNRALGLLMEHYNDVARTLMDRPDRYSPLFAVDERNGDILWELWIEGFKKAVNLRPGTWQKLLNTDADTATAMRGMLMLADIARGDQHLPRKDRDALTATAPDDIARWIVTLNEWRLANYRSMPDAVPGRPSPRRKRSAAMIPVPTAQEENTRGVADFTKRSSQWSSPEAYRAGANSVDDLRDGGVASEAPRFALRQRC